MLQATSGSVPWRDLSSTGERGGSQEIRDLKVIAGCKVEQGQTQKKWHWHVAGALPPFWEGRIRFRKASLGNELGGMGAKGLLKTVEMIALGPWSEPGVLGE